MSTAVFIRLCLTLATAAAALAIVSPASATEFKATGYPATIGGKLSGAESTLSIEGGLTMKCGEGTLTGDLAPGGGPELEVFPTFSSCTVSGFAATVSAAGCAFRGKAASSEIELSCDQGKAITIAGLNCEVQMTPGAEVLSGVSYANSGSPKQVTVEAKVEGIRYNKTKDGFLCPLSGTGEKTDGKLSLRATVAGFLLFGGSQVGFAVE